MKERPIIFSAPMVRALLDGTKMQTRRIMKTQPGDDAQVRVEQFHQTVIDRHGDEQPGPEVYGAWWSDGEHGLSCPYGQPGDRLWVRETFALPDRRADNLPPWVYAADYADRPQHAWKPSIHMPRWASRITLEITGVRVERLQDISNADALAEGSMSWASEQNTPVRDIPSDEARLVFRQLWESIYGPGSWDANPWVWCVELKRVEGGAA